MTFDTLIPVITVRTVSSESGWFVPWSEDTALLSDAVEDAEVRADLVGRLIAISTSGNSLDWDALARIGIDGWGADEEGS